MERENFWNTDREGKIEKRRHAGRAPISAYYIMAAPAYLHYVLYDNFCHSWRRPLTRHRQHKPFIVFSQANKSEEECLAAGARGSSFKQTARVRARWGVTRRGGWLRNWATLGFKNDTFYNDINIERLHVAWAVGNGYLFIPVAPPANLLPRYHG